MEKKYFYVKTENATNEIIYKIDINDINLLALFALTLKPLREDKESFGYVAALDEYFNQNQHELLESYKQIISSSYGRTFLCVVLDLFLLEKQFRNSGVSEESLNLYTRYIKRYQHDLNFNKLMFQQSKQSSDYIKEDEVISWIAAQAFTQEHHGNAISEKEYAYRNQLLEKYKEELEEAKVFIETIGDFSSWSYEQQINYVANLIVELKSKKENDIKLK